MSLLREDGGTGRRVRLRGVWLHRAGSSPALRTKKNQVERLGFFCFLSDEATIEKLCRTDRNLAQKILDKIREFIKVISARFKGDTQTLKTLRTAEKLYVKALKKLVQNILQSLNKRLCKQVVKRWNLMEKEKKVVNPKEEEDLDNAPMMIGIISEKHGVLPFLMTGEEYEEYLRDLSEKKEEK